VRPSWLATALTTRRTNGPCVPNGRLGGSIVGALCGLDREGRQHVPGTTHAALRGKPGPGHVPPRLVTDVERMYVTRCRELTGSSGRTERGGPSWVRATRNPETKVLESTLAGGNKAGLRCDPELPARGRFAHATIAWRGGDRKTKCPCLHENPTLSRRDRHGSLVGRSQAHGPRSPIFPPVGSSRGRGVVRRRLQHMSAARQSATRRL
jgi:hypothetical protein